MPTASNFTRKFIRKRDAFLHSLEITFQFSASFSSSREAQFMKKIKQEKYLIRQNA